MLFKSPELKKERGYVDPKSYVRNDGSEVLYGRDWTQRKRELRERCSGRCERMLEKVTKWMEGSSIKQSVWPEQCRNEAADPHHIIPRSKKRDDRLSNLQALCRMHHDLLDRRKPQWTKKVK